MRDTCCVILVLTLSFVALTGCGSRPVDLPAGDGVADSPSKVKVIVSIVPQVYFVQRVGGDLVEVEPIAPPNYSPETYQVTPRQMDVMGRADIFFRIGMPFEEQLEARLSATFPKLRIVDTREGVPMLAMAAHSDHGDYETEEGGDHDHDHGHHHGDEDPHIWLDPMRVKLQARVMADALKERLPGQAEIFERNLEAFNREMDDLHREIAEILASVQGRAFYVFHPAFGYFADAFGLEQRPIESEGKSPGPRRLYEIMDEIKGAGVKAIFEQPQFKAAELKAVAEETGVNIVLLDGLAGDYSANMKRMALELAAHL